MVSQFLVCGRNENLQTRLEKKKGLEWYHTRKMTGLELLCMHWCLKCYSVVLFFRDLITKILKKKGKTFTSPICSGTVTCAPLRLRLWLPIFIDAHFWHVGLTFLCVCPFAELLGLHSGLISGVQGRLSSCLSQIADSSYLCFILFRRSRKLPNKVNYACNL